MQQAQEASDKLRGGRARSHCWWALRCLSCMREKWGSVFWSPLVLIPYMGAGALGKPLSTLFLFVFSSLYSMVQYNRSEGVILYQYVSDVCPAMTNQGQKTEETNERAFHHPPHRTTNENFRHLAVGLLPRAFYSTLSRFAKRV